MGSNFTPVTSRLWKSIFFQAEDGIRDYKVTGVQTCALPIYHLRPGTRCQPQHPHPLRQRLKQAERISADHQILVVSGIDIEIAVVNTAAENSIIGGNRHDAVAVLDDVLHLSDGRRFSAEDQFAMQIPVRWSGARDGDGGSCDESESPHRRRSKSSALIDEHN